MSTHSLNDALNLAVEAHRAGKLAEADKIYSAILKSHPEHPDANHNLGLIAVSVGKLEPAIKLFNNAIDANSNVPQFWKSLIETLIKLQKYDQAREMINRANQIYNAVSWLSELKSRIPNDGIAKSCDDIPFNNQSLTEQLIDENRFEEAVQVLRDEYKNNQHNIKLLTTLTFCLIKVNQLEEAKKFLSIAESIDNGYRSVRLCQIRLLLKTNHAESALEKSELAKTEFPYDLEVATLHAVCLRANNQPDLALNILQTVLASDPRNFEALFFRGIINATKSFVTEAITDIELAHSLKPNSKDVWNVLSKLYVSREKFDKAQRIFQNMIAAGEKTYENFYFLGLCQHKLNQLSDALENYQKSIDIEPKFFSSHLNMGVIYKELGEYKLAIQSYKIALTVNDRDASAWNNLGNVYKEITDLNSSELSYKKAIELNPEYAEAYFNLGNLYKSLGKFEDAVEAYNKAISLNENYIEALINLSTILLDTGKLQDALNILERALDIDDTNFDVNFNFGRAYKDLNQLEQAISYFQVASEHRPDHSDTFVNIGNIYWAKYDVPKALTFYERAVRIDNTNEKALNNLAVVYKEAGHTKKSIDTYRQALKFNPNSVTLNSNIANALQDSDDLKGALQHLLKAIDIDPQYLNAYINACEAAERWNELDTLKSWICKAYKNLGYKAGDIQFYEIILNYRLKKFDVAWELINSLTDNNSISSDLRLARFYEFKGKTAEKLCFYKIAFESFSKMNAIIEKTPAFNKASADAYLLNAKENLTKLVSLAPITRSNQSGTGPNLAFLVGFPRSGTTLLDTILRSHSKINVIEEKPGIMRVRECALQTDESYDFIKQFPPGELRSKLQDVYFAEMLSHLENDKKGLIIDKLPLNLLELPLINYLFPDAKIIFAARHPIDSILSNWMQNYKLNSAMANMTVLNRIAELYAVSIETLNIAKSKLPIQIHTVRYEDLLRDLSSVTSELLSFLDLEWEDSMLRYRDTAIERGKIHTPSYAQVTQPIYHDSMNKWTKYSDYFYEGFVEELNEYIDQLGY